MSSDGHLLNSVFNFSLRCFGIILSKYTRSINIWTTVYCRLISLQLLSYHLVDTLFYGPDFYLPFIIGRKTFTRAHFVENCRYCVWMCPFSQSFTNTKKFFFLCILFMILTFFDVSYSEQIGSPKIHSYSSA